MDVWKCLVIFGLLHIGVSGITILQCTGPTPQAIEFIEGVPGQTIICDDIGQSDDVFWLTVSSGTATIVTQCASPNSACTNPGAVFTATRNSTSSTLTVTSSITRNFAGIEMRCQVASRVITCPLDVVYPSEATCVAQYNTGSPQWTVSGSCTITKASSELGRYNCSWLYTHNGNGAIQIAYEQTSNSSISQIPGSNAYFSFTCNFSMPFPSVEGTYGYSTVLYPGNVKKSATFSGSSVVVDPTTPSHDCPLGAVKEGTTITCNCTITSLGSPPGTLAWKDQSGPQLHLINVTLSQNNRQYTCQLRRGTTVVKETKYTLKVAGSEEQCQDRCLLYLLLLLLLVLFLPLPIPLPWPGYPIYVVLCRIPHQSSNTGWHTHYVFGRRTNDVYFSAFLVTNDGRAVLIWSRSPTTRRFVCYGTETTPSTNRNNVSPESAAVNNGNKHSSQKEKNKHTGTDGSSRKSRQPEAPVELTTVRTSSPPQAATVHGDNQASGTPHADDQASGTPRLRPLPEPSRMTSVERNSTAEYSNMLGRDKQPKLPPIRKHDNHP